MNQPNRELPYHIDAEEGLLGACIIDGGRETLGLCLENKLTPDSFYKPAHKIIFEVMVELFNENSIIDEVVMSDRLMSKTVSTLKGRTHDSQGHKPLLEYIGGDAALSRLTSRIETTVFASHYIEIVKEKSQLRRMITTCSSVAERCYTQQDSLPQFIAQVEQEIFAISQDNVSDSTQPIEKCVDAANQTIKQIMNRKGQLAGIPSGLVDLDRMLLGFHKSEMIVLAARPSMGKTALALRIIEGACIDTKTPKRCLFFSLEMSAESLAMRLMCMTSRVDSERVRGGFLNTSELIALEQGSSKVKAAPILIDDTSGLNITELRAKARRQHAIKPLDIILIDYLQLLAPTDSRIPREQQVAEISRGVKAMAKEFKIPVIVLCQINRESEKENRAPRISDLRESGAIEQDADVVLMLYKKKDKEGIAMDGNDYSRDLLIAKQRNGPVDSIKLGWEPQFTRFTNFAQK